MLDCCYAKNLYHLLNSGADPSQNEISVTIYLYKYL